MRVRLLDEDVLLAFLSAVRGVVLTVGGSLRRDLRMVALFIVICGCGSLLGVSVHVGAIEVYRLRHGYF